MLSLEEAVERILAAMPPPTSESATIGQAPGRYLALSVSSPTDLPMFDNSAMDGFAVRAEDVARTKGDAPVSLRLAGRSEAGKPFMGELTSGHCVRVFTGSALPRGADAVVMQEDTQMRLEAPGRVFFLSSVTPWENVRLQGEDIKQGTPLAEAGDVLTAGRIGLLAGTGVSSVTVTRRPTVGLLATGSELKEPGQPLSHGQIYESNRLALAALCSRAGAVPKLFPFVQDALEPTCRALNQAFSWCDLVVTSGGASVGEMDLLKPAFAEIGGELQFWKVAIRPGRPFIFGRCRDKFLFGLPGNPVSAFVTFLLLVRPALLRWQGARQTSLPSFPGILAEPVSNPGERRHFLRVRTEGNGKVYSSGLQASHALSSLAGADGLIDLPPRAQLAEGVSVRVLRWDP